MARVIAVSKHRLLLTTFEGLLRAHYNQLLNVDRKL